MFGKLRRRSPGSIHVAADSGVKRAWIEGQIIRADGTVEDIGVLCSTDTTRKLFFRRIGDALWRRP